MPTSDRRLIVVSNRLPVVLSRDAQGAWHGETGAGGLVTALIPILRERGGLWIGWPGVTMDEEAPLTTLLAAQGAAFGFQLEAVPLTAVERDEFYIGFSNEVIWPLFHDLQSRCTFTPRYWHSYRQVNRTFAACVAAQAQKDDYVWVHDYHLMHVAQELRALGATCPVAFFLHIPFPPPDIFLKLPWRSQILHALLSYDRLGFQTPRDGENFLACVRVLIDPVELHAAPPLTVIRQGGRQVIVGAFPISIDAREFITQSMLPAVEQRIQDIQRHLPGMKLMLGVDRLDYTKGILERLRAFDLALERYPELHRTMIFIQVVVPSRTGIPEYLDLKTEIDLLVSEINGRWTKLGWVPIHYLYRTLDRTRLLAYYRVADIALITPLKDGMNLVAKEYSICNTADGVLILSEFAGASAQLTPGALLVNPYDTEGVAAAIHTAWAMLRRERHWRLEQLKHAILREDIFWWVEACLADTPTVPAIYGALTLEESAAEDTTAQAQDHASSG